MNYVLEENKWFVINLFCSPTSICTCHRCHLRLNRLVQSSDLNNRFDAYLRNEKKKMGIVHDLIWLESEQFSNDCRKTEEITVTCKRKLTTIFSHHEPMEFTK